MGFLKINKNVSRFQELGNKKFNAAYFVSVVKIVVAIPASQVSVERFLASLKFVL